MLLEQIYYLRQAVKRMRVAWHPDNDTCLIINDVPKGMKDPDNTGVPDYIAILQNGGHIDLTGIQIEDFVVLEPLFAVPEINPQEQDNGK